MSHSIADYLGAFWFVCFFCSFITVILGLMFDKKVSVKIFVWGLKGLGFCAIFLAVWLMIVAVFVILKG